MKYCIYAICFVCLTLNLFAQSDLVRTKKTKSFENEKIKLTCYAYHWGAASMGQFVLCSASSQDQYDVKSGPIEDYFYNLELLDLDKDLMPEAYLFFRSAGSGSYGRAQPFVWTGKKMRPIKMPDIDDTYLSGYMGHDQFYFQENILIREFPIYLPNDHNSTPSGGRRTLSFSFSDGSFKLKEVNNICPAKKPRGVIIPGQGLED